MKVAVVSLTRDRLESTQHCFAALTENAGCDYDHWVLDQGSTDGTREWLEDWQEQGEGKRCVELLEHNIGISAGINRLLGHAETVFYDVIVKVDNDADLLTPDTLRVVCDLVHTYGLLLSPQIRGLRNPPQTLGKPLSLGGALVDEKAQIGGIFLAAPADLFDTFRYSETNPLWGGDDVEICAYWRQDGGKCGYVRGYEANHYLGTDGQHARWPGYFERTLAEGKARL